MSEYYKGCIKVVGADAMCFRVDPATLDPMGCSVYDPFHYLPEDGCQPVEVIGLGEWNLRRNKLRECRDE
ncbi:hypothetical protein FHW69_001651 [Luteibacter sp. Sphag1AF]|uniref:hypothetical protein n=1 Tax=Luteibacter sp. Sphag1AF TaxID=2587031 RepID=UPI00160EA5CF|nr:hypothetical protein [Luteibacter sp. Sphag1AF]MBB3227050.1 hypothetical protein [Luteibacter sp. Sphag1AF]